MSSKKIWEKYGEYDPYYAVLTLDQYRKRSIEQNKGSFFASGESQVAETLALVEAAIGSIEKKHALDFGAGVGRLTFPLADRFEKVSSIDISSNMLAELKRNIGARSNIHLYQSIVNLSQPVDFALSLITLQHIPTLQGREIISQIWKLLSPGGVLALEVPILCNHSRVWELVRNLRDRMPFTGAAQSIFNNLSGRSSHDGGMQMNVYPLNHIVSDLIKRGANIVYTIPANHIPFFQSVIIVSRKTDANSHCIEPMY